MDTLIHIATIPDTLRFIAVNTSHESFLEWKTLIAVLLGGAITIIGNYIIVSMQRKSESRRAFFDHHIAAYKEFSSACWKGHSVAIKDTDPRPNDAYPNAYEDNKTLRDWLNEMVITLDKYYVLIDSDTYDVFQELNALVISHLQFLHTHRQNMDVDLLTRNVGRDNVARVQELTREVLKSCRRFLRTTYDAPLPDFKS